MNTKSLAILTLSLKGYEVFTSIEDSHYLIAYDKTSKSSHRCVVRAATPDNTRYSVMRLGNIEDVWAIVGVDGENRSVWVIPLEDIEGLKCVRLGERWNEYKTTFFPQTTTQVDDMREKLREAASSVAKSIKQE